MRAAIMIVKYNQQARQENRIKEIPACVTIREIQRKAAWLNHPEFPQLQRHIQDIMSRLSVRSINQWLEEEKNKRLFDACCGGLSPEALQNFNEFLFEY